MRNGLSVGVAILLWASASGADDLADLPDPTRPYVAAAEPAPGDQTGKPGKLKLQSIMLGPGGSYAIINGQRVSEGAYIEGVRVESIQPDGVMVAKDSERRLLTLGGSQVVKQR